MMLYLCNTFALLLLSSPSLSNAFTVSVLINHHNRQLQRPTRVTGEASPLSSSSSSSLGMSKDITDQDVKLVVTGNNIDLTPALNEYVEKRIGGLLDKLGSGGIVRECDVHLSVYKNPKIKNAHRVDLTAILKGLTVHCKEEREDMYTAIDAAASALSSKLRKYRTRRKQGWHSGNSMAGDLMIALEQAGLDDEVNNEVKKEFAKEERDEEFSRLGDFIDPEAPNIMKVNSYDLENPIPVKEAIFALDYVDHDFFVFRNEETGKASVIYKRNAGGVGLIEIP